VTGVIAVLGRQGAGKGTQCALLVERYSGVVHVSTGDVLREAAAADTALGRRAAAIMEAGELVPDDVMCDVVAERLASLLRTGAVVLLDGFPRTPPQAEALVEMTGGDGVAGAVLLDVDVDEVSDRMIARGRTDDTAAGIARRLELYESQTAPLVEWFDRRGMLRRIDGVGSPEKVFDRLAAAVCGLVPLVLSR
jgi:adenylate kinase